MILLQISGGMALFALAFWLLARVTAPTQPEPFEYPSGTHMLSAVAFVVLLMLACIIGAVGLFFL